MEQLHNGGSSSGYRWGQTLEEVTVHVPLPAGVRARDLAIDIRREKLRVAPKQRVGAGGAEGPTLDGTLAQPVLCEESTWMVEDGVLVLQLAKDNMRAENTGPSCEWWNGLFAGEDTLETASVSINDYARASMLQPAQRAELESSREAQQRQLAAAVVDRQQAAKVEADLPADKRKALESLRASFPDIPIEWGDTGAVAAPAIDRDG